MATLLKLAGADRDVPDLHSVPALLRNIAKHIEEGSYGIAEAGPEPIVRGALVLRVTGREPQIFGLGKTDPAQTHMDFHAGMMELVSMVHPERS